MMARLRIHMITAMTMTTSSSLYRLLAWLSPSFPVGAFSYSHGLEYAVEIELIKNRDDLVAWCAALLRHGSGLHDAMLFVAAWRALDAQDHGALMEIFELSTAMRPTSELALETQAQGAAFARAIRDAWPLPDFDPFGQCRDPLPVPPLSKGREPWGSQHLYTSGEAGYSPPLQGGGLGRGSGDKEKAAKPSLQSDHATPSYPLSVALCAHAHGIDMRDALAAYLHAFTANLISAGVRLIPLGQTDGQIALRLLEADVAASAELAQTLPLEEIGSATPMLDYCSAQHETQYTRLFRS